MARIHLALRIDAAIPPADEKRLAQIQEVGEGVGERIRPLDGGRAIGQAESILHGQWHGKPLCRPSALWYNPMRILSLT